MYEERDKKILLGQSMNQAVEIVKIKYTQGNIKTVKDLEACYIEMVERFYKWNTGLQDRLLQEEQPVDKKTSAKTKPCPKCQESIPSSWNAHFACGWKE